MKRLVRKFFVFGKRGIDWWFFTLLPIVVILFIAVYIYSLDVGKQGVSREVFILITQQLLAYALILSCNELRLRAEAKEPYYPVCPPLFLILATLLLLSRIYTRQDYIALMFFLSVIMSYFAVLLYSNNPGSNDIGPEKFIKGKYDSEKKAEEVFESKEEKSTMDVKWGSADE